MPHPAPQRIPLTVVGGFLGAGKTTLLNHWLRHCGAQRVALLINDFGALNIDAELIDPRSNAGDALIRLTNGCVCCQIGDDLTMALIRVLDGPSPPDAVVIEASGVSDPWRIAQMGRADPRLSLDGVVVLVDAGAVQDHARDPLLADTLHRQLRAADLIVVNKIDRVDARAVAEVGRWIASIAGGVTLWETTQARVPLALLSGAALATPPEPERCTAHARGQAHADVRATTPPDHGGMFETWSCRPAGVFAVAALRAWLNAPPEGLLRLKGVVRTSASEWSELQFAGRHGALRACRAPLGGAAVVAIARHGRLPRHALQAAFDGPQALRAR
jgi:G3E family GTPase